MIVLSKRFGLLLFISAGVVSNRIIMSNNGSVRRSEPRSEDEAPRLTNKSPDDEDLNFSTPSHPKIAKWHTLFLKPIGAGPASIPLDGSGLRGSATLRPMGFTNVES